MWGNHDPSRLVLVLSSPGVSGPTHPELRPRVESPNLRVAGEETSGLPRRGTRGSKMSFLGQEVTEEGKNSSPGALPCVSVHSVPSTVVQGGVRDSVTDPLCRFGVGVTGGVGVV